MGNFLATWLKSEHEKAFAEIFSQLSELECGDFLDAARFSLLAYADELEVGNLAKNHPAKWTDVLGTESSTKLVWPSFESYKDDHKVIHNLETDADVLLAAKPDQVRIYQYNLYCISFSMEISSENKF